jgi:hypothetical protein
MTMKSTPYASASSGDRARNEITKLLRRFGCEKIGFMDDLATQELLPGFRAPRAAGRIARQRQGLGRHVVEDEPLAVSDAASAA